MKAEWLPPMLLNTSRSRPGLCLQPIVQLRRFGIYFDRIRRWIKPANNERDSDVLIETVSSFERTSTTGSGVNSLPIPDILSV